MQHVDARAGPLGEDRRAGDRFNRHNVGTRGEMGQRVDAARGAQPRFAPFHDRVGFGVQRDTLAGRATRSKAPASRRSWGWHAAEGVAHVELEADTPPSINSSMLPCFPLQARRRVRNRHRPFRARCVFGGKRLGRRDGRNGVRHVEYGCDPAKGGRGRAAGKVLLVDVTGIAKMDVDVDSRRAGCAARRRRASRAPAACFRARRCVDRAVGDGECCALISASGATITPPWITRSAVDGFQTSSHSSQRRPAAVDRNVGAGDLSRGVAGEKQAGVGDVTVQRIRLSAYSSA